MTGGAWLGVGVGTAGPGGGADGPAAGSSCGFCTKKTSITGGSSTSAMFQYAAKEMPAARARWKPTARGRDSQRRVWTFFVLSPRSINELSNISHLRRD